MMRVPAPLRAVLTVAVVTVAATASVAADPAPTKVGTVEGITEYTLTNGLHVLLIPDPSQPKVTVNATVYCGSRHEGYGETGMAHVEHMIYGTYEPSGFVGPNPWQLEG